MKNGTKYPFLTIPVDNSSLIS